MKSTSESGKGNEDALAAPLSSALSVKSLVSHVPSAVKSSVGNHGQVFAHGISSDVSEEPEASIDAAVSKAQSKPSNAISRTSKADMPAMVDQAFSHLLPFPHFIPNAGHPFGHPLGDASVYAPGAPLLSAQFMNMPISHGARTPGNAFLQLASFPAMRFPYPRLADPSSSSFPCESTSQIEKRSQVNGDSSRERSNSSDSEDEKPLNLMRSTTAKSKKN